MAYLIDRYYSFRRNFRRTNTPRTNPPRRRCSILKYYKENENAVANRFPPGLALVNDRHSKDDALNYLQTQMANLANSSGRIGYFSLPGEIRNKIMKYVLTWGQIHLHENILVPKDVENRKPATSLILAVFGYLMKYLHKSFPGYRHLPDGIPTFLVSQLVAFFPKDYVETLISFWTVDLVHDTLAELREFRRNATTEKLSRGAIAGCLVNSLLDQLFGRPPVPVSGPVYRPAPQFLATCKQVHLEGHMWYYTDNMFFLPRGEISSTYRWFNTLQPQHQDVIQAIGIRFGLGDLTEEDLDGYEYFRGKERDGVTAAQREDCGSYLASCALDNWTAKLVFARSLTSVKVLRLETDRVILDLDGGNLQQSLNVINSHNVEPHGDTLIGAENAHVNEMLHSAFRHVYREVRRLARSKGWPETKRWLRRGAGGQF